MYNIIMLYIVYVFIYYSMYILLQIYTHTISIYITLLSSTERQILKFVFKTESLYR